MTNSKETGASKWRIVDSVTGEVVRDPKDGFAFEGFDTRACVIEEYDYSFGTPFSEMEKHHGYRAERYTPVVPR